MGRSSGPASTSAAGPRRSSSSGPGQGSWHWGLGSGEVPEPENDPDVVITGRAPQFALVAGRRLALDDALASGNVVLGGDLELAGVVILRSIRAYP